MRWIATLTAIVAALAMTATASAQTYRASTLKVAPQLVKLHPITEYKIRVSPRP